MVLLYERAKAYVIIFAGRTRHPFLVVKIAGNWHTKQQWPSVNPCKRTQKQLHIDPGRGCIHAVPKCCVTTTNDFFSARPRSFCNLAPIRDLGSVCARDKLRPFGCSRMKRRRGLDLMPNVIGRREMILQLKHGCLCFSDRPERAENDAIKPTARSQAF